MSMKWFFFFFQSTVLQNQKITAYNYLTVKTCASVENEVDFLEYLALHLIDLFLDFT